MYTPPTLTGAEMENCVAELRTIFPPNDHDAIVIYDRVTRLQLVRFANRRLLLPCLVFRVQSLSKGEANTYHTKASWLGDTEFTTEDILLSHEPRRLVFVYPWIRRLCDLQDEVTSEDEFGADADETSNSGSGRDEDIDAEIMHASLVEEAPAPLDRYTRALQLIARLGQPFNASLLLKQPDWTYKRLAAENEIVVRGLGCNVPKDIRARGGIGGRVIWI